MFIRRFDFLSPSITFYHKHYLSHSSIISGIISIFAAIIIIAFAIYFSLEIIQHKNPKAFYFNSFVDDAGIYPLNSSSFFHYISMYEESNDLIDKGINFRNLRIIGLDTYFHYYSENKSRNIMEFDHWLYGYCNNDSDTEGIGYLIKEADFQKAACIKKYFDSSEKRYYNIGEGKFRWPIIAHGTYHPNKTFYNVFVERCKEETIEYVLGEGYHCSSDKEIKEMYDLRGALHFYFIDNYVDVLNYEQPSTKYFYRIENGIDRDNYAINHLNLNPTTIKTNNGLIFENIEKEHGYLYDRNDVNTYSTKDNEIVMAYYLWLNNRMYFYERSYMRVQEVISHIGGVSQFILYVSVYINYLYNNYIIISDTKKLLAPPLKREKTNEKMKKYNLEKLKNHSKNYKLNAIKNISKENSEKAAFNTDKINHKENLLNSKNNISASKINSLVVHPTDINDKSKSIKEIDNKKDNATKIKNSGNRFYNYLIYKFTFEKRNTNFKFYENFRIKIISEEQLILNHLNIYNLLKLAKKKKSFKRNSLQLQDLIKLYA